MATPPATIVRRHPALLERSRDLASIGAALASSRGGTGELVVVEGAAGIGKSALLAEARRRAADAGMAVLHARGSELEEAFAYGIVRQLFEPALASIEARERRKLFRGAAEHARRLFEPGGVGEPAPASDDAAFAQLHGLYWLTVNLAEARPFAVAIDDVHWADLASLRWLLYLARRLEGLQLCLLVALRSPIEENPLLTDLLTDRTAKLVRPAELTPEAVTELVETAVSARADAEFCLACHELTGGNPLLVHELIRTLIAEQIPPTATSTTRLEALAPDAVTRSVRQRVAHVSPEAAAVLGAAALLGDAAETAHVAELAGLHRQALTPAIAELARAGLLRPDPPVRFVHPLLQTAVYTAMTELERGQEHARAAALLVRTSAPPETISSQLLLAPPNSIPEAAAVLRETAGRAAAEGAFESAARYLRRALEEPLEDELRTELLLDLAASEYWLGLSIVEPLREAVALLRDPERRTVAFLELARALTWANRLEEAIETLEQALAERGGKRDERGLLLEAELISTCLRLPSRAAEASRRLESLDVDAVEGPAATLIAALSAFHDAGVAGDRARAVARAKRSHNAEIVPTEERALGYGTASYTLLYADELDEGLRGTDEWLTNERRKGAVFTYANELAWHATFSYAGGALIEAEADARSAIAALPHRHVIMTPLLFAMLAQILVERGAIEDAASALATAETSGETIADTSMYVPLFVARGVLAAARGDHGAALAAATSAGRILDALGRVNPAVLYPAWRTQAAVAHHALGATDVALDLAREEVELARRWGAPRPLGRALRLLGTIEGGQSGSGHIQEALAVLEQSPARLEYAYALADLGAALRRANKRASARDHLRQALELAHRLGANLLAAKAHQELVAAGARPRRLRLSGVDALTPSERRVSAMAADGMSNREIAQALFVTPRTVEMHLSGAFRKLAIRSRTQLATALAAAPLADPAT